MWTVMGKSILHMSAELLEFAQTYVQKMRHHKTNDYKDRTIKYTEIQISRLTALTIINGLYLHIHTCSGCLVICYILHIHFWCIITTNDS
jgi:hypothetical protein